MEFILLASAHFLALLSPGPDFFLIINTALKKPFRYVISIITGITLANAVYLLIAVLGLELIKNLSTLTLLLKYFGAVYLMFIGIMLLKTKRQKLEFNDSSMGYKGSLITYFVMGFLSGFLNPKNIIFYLSLFTVMVSNETSLFTRSLYALWMCSLVFFWDVTIAMLIAHKAIKQKLFNWFYVIEKLTGIILASFGVILLW